MVYIRYDPGKVFFDFRPTGRVVAEFHQVFSRNYSEWVDFYYVGFLFISSDGLYCVCVCLVILMDMFLFIFFLIIYLLRLRADKTCFPCVIVVVVWSDVFLHPSDETQDSAQNGLVLYTDIISIYFFRFEIKSVTNVSCGKPDVACHSLSRPPCVWIRPTKFQFWIGLPLLHSSLVMYHFCIGRIIFRHSVDFFYI